MTKNSDVWGIWESSTKNKKYSMKTCSISGRKFKATTENFYRNNNSSDGLHPYHKEFDNFRRVTGTSVNKVRNLVNLIKG
jgi:hypothetical protein